MSNKEFQVRHGLIVNGSINVSSQVFMGSMNLVHEMVMMNTYTQTVATQGSNTSGVVFDHSNNVYAAVNSAFGVINAAFASANNVAPQIAPAFNTANAAFNTANTKLASAGGTITGDLVVQGNATFSGVTTYANTQTLLIGDNLVTLNADIPNNVAPSENSGLEINRGSSANVAVLWNEGSDRWTFTNDGTSYFQIASNVDVSTVDSRLTSAYGVANAAFGQSNTEITRLSAAYVVANAAFGAANSKVASVSGTSGRITSSGGTTPAIDLATAGAGAASYSSGISALTVDAYGRVTSVTGSAGYLTGITSGQVTTALGYTPYNSTNPSGYITSSASITGTAAGLSGLYTATNTSVIAKRRNRIHTSDGTSLNSSITSPECGFTYGGSGETTGPYICFGGLGGVIDYSCQFVANYGDGTIFQARTRNDDSSVWNSWRRFLIEDVWINSKHFGSDGNIYSNVSMRAPIFYDQNDTARYVDPNGTSILNNVQAHDWFRNHGEQGLYSQSYGQHFYPDSGGYWWECDGGIRIREGYEGTIRGHLGYHDGNGFGILNSSGNWQIRMEFGNANMELYNITFANDIRPNILYDRQDTAYYCDPNSVSRLWRLDVVEWIYFNGFTGLYSPNNGAHFHPNDISYGSWRCRGSRNGWSGIEFDAVGGQQVSLMVNVADQGFHNNSVGWRFYITGGSGHFPGNVVAYWSDIRLKENLRPIGREATDILSKLTAYRFNWNEKVADFEIEIQPGKEEIGLIAQEVQSILPDAVQVNKSANKVNKDGNQEESEYLTINWNKITPLLVQALNDTTRELNELKQLLKDKGVL